MATKCEKCGRTLQECQACKGGRKSSGFFGALNCGRCKNTGQVCPSCGGNWQK